MKMKSMMLAALGFAIASVTSAQVGGEQQRGGPFLSLEAVGGCGSGNICQFANVINNTTNQEKTLAFYEAVFGLEMEHLEKEAVLSPFERLAGAPPGVWSRRSITTMPGALYQLEFTEWTKVPVFPVVRRFQDPGNVALVFRVRDVDATLAIALKSGATTVTTDGKPVVVTNPKTGAKEKSIFVRDPDGVIFGLQQASQSEQAAAAGRSPIVSVDAIQTTASALHLKKYWNGIGGVGVTDGKVSAVTPEEMKLWGIEGVKGRAQVRRSVVSIDGTKSDWNAYEFINVPSNPVRPRGIDPGATQLQFRIINIDSAIDALRQTGGYIVSAGGVVAQNGRAVFTHDPDGVIVCLVRMAR